MTVTDVIFLNTKGCTFYTHYAVIGRNDNYTMHKSDLDLHMLP